MKTFVMTVLIAVSMAVSGGLCSAGVPDDGKTLIVYYSRTGNTRAACKTLQKELGTGPPHHQHP